jgi:16S rRNA (guanine527-N7)-methyltransferase
VWSDATLSALGGWLDLLAVWNARVDLTAARSADELVDLMLADAVALSRTVARGARVVDVGAGAGAPGLALAILRPDLALTLVDPLAKRVAFLRTVLGTLGLANVELQGCKVEAVTVSAPWDVAMARATFAPSVWLDRACPLLREGGEAWVFLAKEERPEGGALEWVEDVAYTWPLTSVSRRLSRYRLAAASDAGR